ncbi:ABC transporter ATP-binding protein [Anaerocolumna cellulosilytica]|uniref:ABC transporter ATP-binding protein n=1 Tax=Anaerocolumna cellulosilytica TaxID=433286 RepID=A0A6S6RA78_9FIRM|nr:ABC transporter ATP-binding protein [Anaerocolumna cellulosilytica]MBB5196758.1 ATP-binding cassette subfamily B protein [Anaerocolumna cellulosilytica]BCJ95848.1 ABC transporter ATP-binding protein [Anaerocolumna cellulosilytica]
MARNKYDIDETLQSEFSFEQLKRLYAYIKPHRKEMLITILLMITSSALGMFTPKILMKIMDVYIPNKDINGIIRISLVLLLINFIVVVFLRLKIQITTKLGQTIIHEIRSDIFNHLQELPFSYYDDRPHGKIQVRVVNYVNSLSDLLSNGIVNTITELFSLFFIVGFMLSINIRLTLVCMLGLPALMTLIFVIKKKQRVAWQISSNKSSNLNAYIAESINGIRVTQSFVREQENIKIFNSLSSNYSSAWMNAVKYNFLLWPAIDNISTLTTSAVYFLGVSWISQEIPGITVGVLIAFTGYIGRFWAPVNTLASFYNSLLTAISYLERIFETIDEPVLVKDIPDAVEMPPIKGDVEFKDVCFSYEDGIRILNQVSFRAKQGESFAIVGPTGAGKTTIINLISRFYNLDSGQILIDGVDISQVTIKSLRKQMGVMLQDSFIFSGTIIDNIRYGNMEATDEQVIFAAKTVCAHDFIMELENGYYTEVNERGSRLSAGQRQLISFARALLADPKILILDEATSSIDTETEILLQEGLTKLLANRTSFIIAHRLSTIKNSSCILYVDKGIIQEMGNHETLMKQKGYYHELFVSQYDFLNKEAVNS